MTPEDLRSLTDAHQEANDARLEASRQLKKLEEKETEARRNLLDAMEECGADASVGTHKLSRRVTADIPISEDWQKIEAWAIENNKLAIFQRRLSEAFVNELTAEGVEIPGVGWFEKVSLSRGTKL